MRKPKKTIEKPSTSEDTAIEKQESVDDRLRNLLSGKTEPKSDAQRYLIEKTNNIRAEREVVVKDMKALEEQLRKLQQRRLDLEAQSNAYLEDILHFDAA